MARFFKSALFPLIVIVILVYIATQFLTGCGGESVSIPCQGTVVEKYVKYVPGPSVNVGSGISVPTGSSRFIIAGKRSDGEICTKRLKENDWIVVEKGASWPSV